MGKEPGTKAYRLFDLEEKIVYVSRDVNFEEENAWPWNQIEKKNDEQLVSFSILNTYLIGNKDQNSYESEHTYVIGTP